MAIRSLLLLLMLSCISKIKASDTTMVSQLLARIEQLQVKESGVFPKGIFPSYRTYAINKDRQKADMNLFFTSLILFTLDKIKDKLTPYQQTQVQHIKENAKPAVAKFKNKSGRNTYNFWPTDTVKVFPNSGWLNIFDKINALPDDMDDTVIMLLADNVDVSVAKEVHRIMQEYTNIGNGQQIKNIEESFKKYPAYSTWFGKNYFIEFDISVLANVLYFVQFYNLPFTKADQASIQVIVEALKNNLHMTSAVYVSPQYGKSEIILYHLSRLMTLKAIPALEIYRSKLIDQTTQLLQKKQPFLMQVILSSALLNWGIKPATFTIQQDKSLNELIEDDSFSFFIANMGSIMPKNIKKAMTVSSIGKFNYYCPAYNNLLLLENIVLHQSIK